MREKKIVTAKQYDLALRHKIYLHKNAHEIKITEGAYFESEIMYGYELVYMRVRSSAL